MHALKVKIACFGGALKILKVHAFFGEINAPLLSLTRLTYFDTLVITYICTYMYIFSLNTVYNILLLVIISI